MNTIIGLILGTITLTGLLFLLVIVWVVWMALRIALIFKKAHGLYQKRQYDSAILLFNKCVKLSRKIMQVTRIKLKTHAIIHGFLCNNLGTLYNRIGNVTEALYLYEEALLMTKNTVFYAIFLNNLADLKQQMGRFNEAREMYEEALLIIKNAAGEQDANYGITLNDLAKLNREMGRLPEAREGFEQALLILSNTVGEQNESYARALTGLAYLNQQMGRLPEAREQYKQALSIKNLVIGQDESYAATLHDLAYLNQKMNRLEEAREGFEQSLRITQNTIGEQNESYAVGLCSLAHLNQQMGRLSEAKEGFEQALWITKNIVGEQNESYSATLHGLAGLNKQMGRFSEAREGFEQALWITKNTVGEQNESYFATLHNLALLETADNNPLKALSLFQWAEEINLKIIEQVFLVSSDNQRLDYLQRNYYHLEMFLSFVWQYLPNYKEAILFAYDYVLRRKAIASETALKQHLQLLSGAYPHLADKLEEKRQIAEQITFLRLQNTPLTDKLAHIEQLEREKQKIEAELSREIDFPLASELKKADRRAVALELPTGSTLLEFVRFRVHDFHKSQRYEARYLAFILPAGQPDNITMIDLGETESIDRLIEIFRENVEDSRKYKQQNKNKTVKDTLEEQKQQSQANKQEIEAKKRGLKYLIFDKIQPYLTPEIFIAPDSFLNLLPFEILPNDKNGYLMDDYNFNYLSVGRDLLRFKLPSPIPLTTPIIIANPDYNLTLHSAQNPTLQPENWDSPPELLSQLRETMPDQAFSSLPGTVIEAEKIAPLLGVTPISDRHALKTAISKHSRTPKILHIATHGFYQSDIPKPDRNPTDKTPFILADAEINPLRRSGLAFAGVNTFIQGGQLPSEAEDGILTADDITYLNLLGTELVVTSACQTALGKIESGETITGFRRSFIQAGAKTLIVSLWSVPDLATAILMQHFYYYLLQEKRTKADSLKQAKRDICNITIGQMRQEWLTEKAINKVENHSPEMANQLRNLSQKHDHERPYEHPKNWAAFICLGNPSAITT
jgi:CHAT domain-containing protein/Flp pilus assembly protein TadD